MSHIYQNPALWAELIKKHPKQAAYESTWQHLGELTRQGGGIFARSSGQKQAELNILQHEVNEYTVVV